jgi:hypothetical protein
LFMLQNLYTCGSIINHTKKHNKNLH